MKFYDREQEMVALRKIETLSAHDAQMTVITGPRRIGKTTLIKKSFTEIPFVYFFVGKKSETLLCAELSEIIRSVLDADLGAFNDFPRLLGAIMGIAKHENFTLVLDEFQNLSHTRDSIFSDIQNVWDDNKEDCHINLVICGSIYSKMKKIFDDKDEPLYGRATARFKIRPFSIATLKEIMRDNNPNYTSEDLLAMYMITGGVAKYVELLVTRDSAQAQEISKNIDRYNEDRKELDRQITDEANVIIANHKEEIGSKKPIVVYDPNWHKGIIGIVASRLAELYFRPSVVLTRDARGIATGSSRSVRGFDIYTAIKSCRDLLETFGGHTNAVGLSLKVENIPEFRRRLEEYVEQHIQPQQVTPSIDIDAEIKFSEISPDFMRCMKMFNPFGPENIKPVFVTRGCVDAGTSKLVGKNLEHIKLDITDGSGDRVMNGIAFGMDKYFERISAGEPFDIIYTIEENKHRNAVSIQLMIKGIKMHDESWD